MASRECFIETFTRVDATQERARTWLASWFTVRNGRYSLHFFPLQIVLGNGHTSGKEQDMIHIPSSSSRMLLTPISPQLQPRLWLPINAYAVFLNLALGLERLSVS